MKIRQREVSHALFSKEAHLWQERVLERDHEHRWPQRYSRHLKYTQTSQNLQDSGKICRLKITPSGDILGKSSFLSAPLVSMVWIRVGRGGGVTEIELLKWGLRRMTKVLSLIIRSISGCSSPNFHKSLLFGKGSLQLQFQNKNTSVYLPRTCLCILFYPNLYFWNQPYQYPRKWI